MIMRYTMKKKHFCRYCLQAFSIKEIAFITFITFNCFKINGKQKIKKPKNVEYVKFRNFERKINSVDLSGHT